MSLARFAAGRIASGVLFALVVASLALLLARLAPGEPIDDLRATPEEIVASRAERGLDQPALVQYGRWLRGLTRFDLGQSSMFRRPVAGLVAERIGNTAILALAALILATVIGVPLGRFAGSTPGAGARAVRLPRLAAGLFRSLGLRPRAVENRPHVRRNPRRGPHHGNGLPGPRGAGFFPSDPPTLTGGSCADRETA